MFWGLIGLCVCLFIFWLVILARSVARTLRWQLPHTWNVYRQSHGVLIPPPSEESQKDVRLQLNEQGA